MPKIRAWKAPAGKTHHHRVTRRQRKPQRLEKSSNLENNRQQRGCLSPTAAETVSPLLSNLRAGDGTCIRPDSLMASAATAGELP